MKYAILNDSLEVQHESLTKCSRTAKIKAFIRPAGRFFMPPNFTKERR